MFARPSGARANLCLLTLFLLAIFFSISTLITYKHDTPFTCRTWSECGYLERPNYNHDIPADLDVVVDQATSSDGTKFYTREILNLPRPNLLVLVVSKDSASWGSDSLSTHRSPTDLIDLLIRTDLDFTSVSIGLLTTAQEEFDSIKNATRALPFARTSVYLQQPNPSPPEDIARSSSNNNKDEDEAELHARRTNLAQARNYLMLRTLQDEEHILWIDADIVEFSPGLVQKFIDQSNAHAEVGLMTARCKVGKTPGSDYDVKAWSMDPSHLTTATDDDAVKGDAKERANTVTDAVTLAQQSLAASELATIKSHPHDLLDGTEAGGDDNALVKLDSVGATILYVRSALVLRGVSFPAFNVVGTLWGHEGWTGLETEGICYMAERITGKGCYLLGGNNFVRHADLGSTIS